MRSIAGLICLAIFASALSPCRAAAPPSLCKADELIVFSCATGVHTASVCASPDISKNAGYLQYRYGRQDHVDLAYPDIATKAADVFTAGNMTFSGGGGAWLRFSKGPYQYTVFSAIGKWGPNGRPADASGVAVLKDGKEFANFPCHAPSTGELGPEFFDKLGLKAADPGEDFEIPAAFLPK